MSSEAKNRPHVSQIARDGLDDLGLVGGDVTTSGGAIHVETVTAS